MSTKGSMFPVAKMNDIKKTDKKMKTSSGENLLKTSV